ncbi:MAG TPA: IPT/TIG domain-containing protein [Chitinophaga sp.]|uniref:IPT/TIG domain-containing protein n=1 Tax=Chitinophaga sp. TaxID=1869181 RepID=UPI002C5366CC|nr:IPT/TIG domain-containing protein [Chitinophaga sp.]HVI44036.1 IPT/TIG domain-containing protein [Chitinophaga sp.]
MKNIFFFLTAMLLFAGCRKDNKEAPLPLAITGFLPNSGNAGTVVTIRGTGFSNRPENNKVSFNGATARVMSANDTMIIAEAPKDGTTGPLSLSVGDQSIKGNPYTYQSLSVHGISPANGPAGTNIFISGAGFTSKDAPAEVTVNGKKAIVSNANDTLLVVAVPEGAGSGSIQVSLNGMKADGPVFTFQAITKIKPLTGAAGTTVTITGEGFRTNPAENIIAFNGKEATVVSASATSLVVTAPSGVQTGPLSVTINNQKATGPVFTIVPPPSLVTVAPLSGPLGSLVTLNGNYFSGEKDENMVTINGVPVPVVTASVKQLTLNLPQNATSGTVKVVVNGQEVSGPAFKVQQLGLSKLTPDNGLAGTIVNVKGTGFDPVAANNIVTINGLAITVSSATDTTMTVTIPNGIASGTLNINAGGLSATGPEFRRAGVMTLYSGSLIDNFAQAAAIDSKGNIYVATSVGINKFTPDGTGVVFVGGTRGNADGTGAAAAFNGIAGMTIDQQDNIYVADKGNLSIRKVTPDGTVSTLYSNMSEGAVYLAIDARGTLYFSTDWSGIFKFAANGNTSKFTYTNTNSQMTFYNGYLLISNQDGNIVYKLDKNNGRSILAGVNGVNGYVDGPLGQGLLYGPAATLYDPVSGLVYVADAYNMSLRTIDPANGTIGTISGAANTYQPFKGGFKNGTLREALFRISNSTPILVDKKGDVYIIEGPNKAIRKVFLR